MKLEMLSRIAFCIFLFSLSACGPAVQSQPKQRTQHAATAPAATLPCDGEACNAVEIRTSDERCYIDPTEAGFKVFIDNSDRTRRVHVRVNKHGTSPGFPPTDEAVDQEAPARGSGQIGCTQYFSHIPQPDHVVIYAYTKVTAVFVPEGGQTSGGPATNPPRHHRLTDAECALSDRPPDAPGSGIGVYVIRRQEPTNNQCLSYNPDSPEDVPINNCVVEKKKLFTIIPTQNGCYFVRNGNDRRPPATGRCLFVESENSDQLSAKACDQTDQEFWKLYRNPTNGTYNLINQRSGKCLDRDSGGGDNAHVVDCNASEWQSWRLVFIRGN